MKGNWFSVFKVNIYICRGINSSIFSFASVPNGGTDNLCKERIETPLRDSFLSEQIQFGTGFVVQGSKQEVTKDVFFCKYNSKTASELNIRAQFFKTNDIVG